MDGNLSKVYGILLDMNVIVLKQQESLYLQVQQH